MSNYTTNDDVMSFLFPQGGPADDQLVDLTLSISLLLPQVDQAIDDHYGRTFAAVDLASTAVLRYFDGNGRAELFIDDLLAASLLEVNEGSLDSPDWETITSSYYDLWPYNTTPKIKLLLFDLSRTTFPNFRKSVRITAVWGYATTVPVTVQTLANNLVLRMLLKGEKFRQMYLRDTFASMNQIEDPGQFNFNLSDRTWPKDLEEIGWVLQRGDRLSS